jgi:DNA-binding NarL/FixJ family response regulator
MPITILLADDSDLLRRTIRGSLLKHESAIQVIGEAADFKTAVQMTKELRPKILVMDLHLFEFQITPEELQDSLRGTRLLAMSFSNDEEARSLAQTIGAAVYLDKMKLFDELIPAIVNSAPLSSNAAD